MIDQIIDYNKTFVAQKGYEKFITDKYPDKRLAVLSCMDTRLTELLPAALGRRTAMPRLSRTPVDWLSRLSTRPCAASLLPSMSLVWKK